ncbi:hypothetical protein SAMN06295974_0372 [Plantibacter flavus]|uniref:Uncharacterized protein n=1 Tax=Plantibacter flavus TaxID=150123 RepID=A0A3N2C0W1_9MICO|nr:hypothetical protein [Plantibacter flavus]ROR81147.1 hypothetical protein EDD42_1199 [Plantibacter flavus]SMG08329.1 hypothetical protein SAMN06295974_0372 [Plantibacter flavus]
MSARHDFPRTAKEFAENAADHADSAVRVMNEADLPEYRDRAFEEMGFAINQLALAIAGLAERKTL